jgi:hypothetical protein
MIILQNFLSILFAPRDKVIGVNFDKILSIIIGQGDRPLLSIGWQAYLITDQSYGRFGLIRHQQPANQLL